MSDEEKRLCIECETEKELSAFDGDGTVCKECQEARASPTGLEGLTKLLERIEERDKQRDAETERRIADAIEAVAGKLTTPTKTTSSGYHTKDEFDRMGFSGPDLRPDGSRPSQEEREEERRANFEVARMIMDGAGRVSRNPVIIEPTERFLQCYRAAVFEAPGERIQVATDKGRPIRAMDTAETGYGLELMGTQYVTTMWESAKNNDGILNSIATMPMTDPTTYVPIDGAPPEMLFVAESTAYNATAYGTSKTPSSRVSLSAKKFTIQQIWSGELSEDSIIAFTPFLRKKLAESAGLYLGSAYLNGDTTNAGTGNINLDDANPTDTKHYLAWTGIRYYWLVTTTGQGKNMAGELDPKEILRARGKLSGGDDDVDAGIKNANWGLRARDLRLVCDWDTFMIMHDMDIVKTVDKYGPKATVVTGELGSYEGIPIICPPYATKTMADGKCSDTEASNVVGQITLFNPDGWLGGVRRNTQFFMDRIQRTDQFLIELYTRRGFTKFGENVASGIYNITVA